MEEMSFDAYVPMDWDSVADMIYQSINVPDTPVLGPDISSDAWAGMFGADSMLDGLYFDLDTGTIVNTFGAPVDPGVQDSLYQVFGIEPGTGMLGPDPSIQSPESLSGLLSDRLREAGVEGSTLGQEAYAVANGQDPGPGFWAKLQSFLGTPLGRLGATGTLAALGALATWWANSAGAPTPKFAGGQPQLSQLSQRGQASLMAALSGQPTDPLGNVLFSSLQAQGGLQDFMREAIARERAAAGQLAPYQEAVRLAAAQRLLGPQGRFDPIRAAQEAEIMRVMSGQWSNPLLEERARQQQEALANKWFKRGDRDLESTAAQREKAFLDLSQWAAKESDRRGVLSTLLSNELARRGEERVAANQALRENLGLTEFGLRPVETYAASLSNVLPISSLLGVGESQGLAQAQNRFLSDLALEQYRNRLRAQSELGSAIGSVFGAMASKV